MHFEAITLALDKRGDGLDPPQIRLLTIATLTARFALIGRFFEMTNIWIVCQMKDAKGDVSHYGVLMTDPTKDILKSMYKGATFNGDEVTLVPKGDLARLEVNNDNIALLAVRSEEVTSVDANPPHIRTKPNKVKLDNLEHLPVIQYDYFRGM